MRYGTGLFASPLSPLHSIILILCTDTLNLKVNICEPCKFTEFTLYMHTVMITIMDLVCPTPNECNIISREVIFS